MHPSDDEFIARNTVQLLPIHRCQLCLQLDELRSIADHVANQIIDYTLQPFDTIALCCNTLRDDGLSDPIFGLFQQCVAQRSETLNRLNTLLTQQIG